MKANLDKWNYYKEILERRDQEFIKSVLGDKVPEVFYTVEPAFNTDIYYRVGVKTIEKTTYHHKSNCMHLWGKKPTKIAIDNLKAITEGKISYEIDRIKLFWIEKNTSSAISWTDYVEKKNIFYDKEGASIAADMERKKYIEEKALLEAGTHIKCCYCEKVKEVKDVRRSWIFNTNPRACPCILDCAICRDSR